MCGDEYVSIFCVKSKIFVLRRICRLDKNKDSVFWEMRSSFSALPPDRFIANLAVVVMILKVR